MYRAVVRAGAGIVCGLDDGIDDPLYQGPRVAAGDVDPVFLLRQHFGIARRHPVAEPPALDEADDAEVAADLVMRLFQRWHHRARRDPQIVFAAVLAGGDVEHAAFHFQALLGGDDQALEGVRIGRMAEQLHHVLSLFERPVGTVAVLGVEGLGGAAEGK
jgi:hypothetical protein